MNETKRYVAYYRMPSIGHAPYGDTLARQRRDMRKFLDHPNKALVGEFTEVMTPIYEGETSPAFDLSLECCRNLDARLICAMSPADLTTTAREKAARDHIEIILIGPESSAALNEEDSRNIPTAGMSVPQQTTQPEIRPDTGTVPYLRLGRGRQRSPGSPLGHSDGVAPAGNRAKADRFAAAILPVIEEIRQSGATTLTDIAEALNTRNIRTARGRRWYPTTVKNILDRRQ